MKKSDGTFVSAVPDHLIWKGIKQNKVEEIRLRFLFFEIRKDRKKILNIVKAPNTEEVYNATQLLILNIPNTMVNINGQPMDLE